MKTLYKASATTSGGRDGHVKTDDGLIDMKLSLAKGLGGKGVILPIPSNYLQRDIRLAMGVHCKS